MFVMNLKIFLKKKLSGDLQYGASIKFRNTLKFLEEIG